MTSQQSDATNNSVVPETASCWICLENGPDEQGQPLLHGGCACRGDAGYCHVECLANFAELKLSENMAKGRECCHDPWVSCGTCLQTFQGRLLQDLAHLRHGRCKNLDPGKDADSFWRVQLSLDHMTSAYLSEERPEKAIRFAQRKYDLERQYDKGGLVSGTDLADSCNMLGSCLVRLGRMDDAMKIFKEGLAIPNEDSASVRPWLLGGMAEVHTKRSEFDKAVVLRRCSLFVREQAGGKYSAIYIQGEFDLATALISVSGFEEARDLLKDAKKRSQRVLGSDHSITLECSWLLNQVENLPEFLKVRTAVDDDLTSAEIRGLKNREDLNGTKASVVRYLSKKERYEVVLENSNTRTTVKPINIVLEVGAKVVLRGLVSANDMNGRGGEVVSFSEDVGRYMIELGNKNKQRIIVKPENAIVA